MKNHANFGWQMRVMDSCAGHRNDPQARIDIVETAIATAPKWVTQKTKDQMQTTIDRTKTRLG